MLRKRFIPCSYCGAKVTQNDSEARFVPVPWVEVCMTLAQQELMKKNPPPFPSTICLLCKKCQESDSRPRGDDMEWFLDQRTGEVRLRYRRSGNVRERMMDTE